MIQWYPGHMAKAIREISEKVKLVDIVIVLLDARIPKSSVNPEIEKILQNKKVLYVLTKKDKADDIQTRKWVNYFQMNGNCALAVDCRLPKDIKQVIKSLDNMMAPKWMSDAKKGLKPRPIKTMMVGIPNVGKSTLINALAGKKVTFVGDKPGVTKNQQWIRINQNLELLDTPGVLWPKFENETIGYNLASTGAINDAILPIEEVGKYVITFLNKKYPLALSTRYKRNFPSDADLCLDIIGKHQHIYYNNKEVDLDTTARFILQEFRSNMYGKITLEWYENEKND